jgi:DNA gyrase subunit A
VDAISLIGRATQGVKLVNLDKGDVLMDVARIIADDEDEELEAEIARAEEAHSEGAGSGGVDTESGDAPTESGENEADPGDAPGEEDGSDPEGDEV